MDVFNGVAHRLTPEETQRLRRIADGDCTIKSGDTPLLERGLVCLSSHAKDKRERILERVRETLTHHGSLCVMPTEKCNFRCTYCYESFEKGRMSAELQAGVKQFLSSEVSRFKSYGLAFFGGEPLLHVDLIEDIGRHYREQLASNSMSGTIAITTNGYNLQPKTVRRLESVGVDLYHISVDGPSSVHDRQRLLAGGGSTLTTILENIENVMEYSNAHVILRVNLDTRSEAKSRTVQRWLEQDLLARFSAWRERISFAVVAIWDATLTSVDGICIRDVQEFQRWLCVRDAVFKYFGMTAIEAIAEEVAGIGTLSCYAGMPGSFIVGSDGTVYKCSVAFDLPENQVGRLHPTGRMEIDATLQARWTSANVLSDSNCGRCAFGPSCMGIACPLVRIQSGRPPCPTAKKYRQEIMAFTRPDKE